MHSTIKAAGIAALAGSLCAPAAAQPQPAPTAQWFAGTWSDKEDCSATVDFLPDGRLMVVSGGQARWRLEGDVLVLGTGNVEHRLRIERLSQNSLRAVETGVVSYRCEGPNGTRSR